MMQQAAAGLQADLWGFGEARFQIIFDTTSRNVWLFFPRSSVFSFSTNIHTTASVWQDGRLHVQSQSVLFQGVGLRGSAAKNCS